MKWQATREIKEFRLRVIAAAEDLWVKTPALSTWVFVQKVWRSLAVEVFRLIGVLLLSGPQVVVVCAQAAFHALLFVCGIVFPTCFLLIVQVLELTALG